MIITRDRQLGWFALLAGLFMVVAATSSYTGRYEWLILPFGIVVFFAGWQYKSAVFYLLLFSIPFSFEYSFSSFIGTDIPDELLMWLVSFLFLGYVCYKPQFISGKALRHPLMIVLAAWLCWMIPVSLFSTQPVISFKYFLAKGWYMGAFILAPLIILNGKKAIRIAGLTFLTALVVVMFLILIKHWQFDLRFDSVNKSVSPFFRNHVNYSATLVCGIPLLFAGYKFARTHTQRYSLLILMGICLLALFLSYSRGAWLALLAGIIGYGLVRKKLLLFSFIIFILFAVGATLWLKNGDRYVRYAPDFNTTIFHKDFNEHLVATYQLKDISTAERFYRWIAGVRMIKDKPLTGYGPNTFYDNYKSHAVPAYKTWVSRNEDHSTVHNYFLLLAIEQGIPGLIFFLVLLGLMFYYVQYLYHRVRDRFYKTVAITTGVILTMITTLNCLSDLIETDKIGSLFFLCLSVLIVTDVHTRVERRRAGPGSEQ